MSATREAIPSISYIWIGDPPQSGAGILGHDILGPIEMAKKNKSNPLIFWCLDKHVAHYETILKAHNIEVRSIEKHIDGLAKKATKKPEKLPGSVLGASTTENAAWLIQLMMSATLNENNPQSKVQFKDLFSVFLAKSIGGYIFDTNIMPVDGYRYPLPAHAELRFPLITYESGKQTPECFFIFSPAHDNLKTELLFKNYINERLRLLREHSAHAEQIYHAWVCAAFLNAINKAEPEFFRGEANSSKTLSIVFEELGVIKHYYGTHHVFDRAARAQSAAIHLPPPRHEPNLFKSHELSDYERLSSVLSEVILGWYGVKENHAYTFALQIDWDSHELSAEKANQIANLLENKLENSRPKIVAKTDITGSGSVYIAFQNVSIANVSQLAVILKDHLSEIKQLLAPQRLILGQ